VTKKSHREEVTKAVPICGHDLALYSGRLMEVFMVTRFLRDKEGQLDELGSVPGQVGPDGAGQSGGTQGLSQDLDAADESVEDLADTDQAFEAGIGKGVEDADDHPERPVRAYGDHGRHSRSIPASAMPPQTSSNGTSGVTILGAI